MMKKIFIFDDGFTRRRYKFYNIIVAVCALLCFIIFILIIFAMFFSLKIKSNKPNIILILADDMGWNDIGFHGSDEIPTPNIDALAYHGAILNRHYTQSVCTPSRAALLTGKYPIRTGMQGGALPNNIRVSLPLNLTLLPQYLKKRGYTTGLVGKWHLGMYRNASTPTERGFDSFFGYYGGWVQYNDSKTVMPNIDAYDARRNFMEAGNEFAGKYNTDVYTDEAIKLISTQDQSKPLYLQLAYTAVHAIWGGKLQVRNFEENEKRFAYIEDPNRRMFAGVLSALDSSVGRVIHSLDENGMLENSIIIFMTDNGGQTGSGRSLFQNYGSNWPLRGMKGSILEGGVRGVTAIWSPYVQQNVVLTNLMHLTDWLPTLYEATGGGRISDIDGINQWKYLTGAAEEAPRSQLLVNIDEKIGAAALISGDWKLVKSRNNSVEYLGSTGRNISRKYDMNEVLSTSTHVTLSKYDKKKLNEIDFWRSRSAALIDDSCKARLNPTDGELRSITLPCFETTCLFNLKSDACEFTDLSKNYAHKLNELKQTLEVLEAQVVKQWSAKPDPESNPKYHHGYVTPWVL